jgi:hypothetical protein
MLAKELLSPNNYTDGKARFGKNGVEKFQILFGGTCSL